MYVVGFPPAAFQDRLTVAPFGDPINELGAVGATKQPPPTTRIASFEGPLTPALFHAFTRT